jgi:hypothetical protein
MKRSHIVAALASLACTGSIGVAQAQAVEYAHHVGIASGANHFGPFVTLFDSEVRGYGAGIGCAGIRGISGVVCENEPGAIAAEVLGNYVNSEPYIHNHATFTSYFDGWYH